MGAHNAAFTQESEYFFPDEYSKDPAYQYRMLANAAQERLSRMRARRSFGHFVERTIPYPLEDWQWVLCDRLSQLQHQKGQRLLIHGFPQSGKSILLSQRFPAWMLGVQPTHRVRLACYNETHSARFSEVNINLMMDPDYKRIFPSEESSLGKTKPAVAEWSTLARAAINDANPSFRALGLGSGFTGMGVDLGLIDDPYKNRAEAFSNTINETIWFWWTTVLMSRCNPDTNLVVMFHRWRENDLAGRLMGQGGWEVLRFAAIGDGKPDDPMKRAVGIALSPRYPIPYLKKVQQVQGELDFLALFQGNPTNAAGTIIKAAHILPTDEFGHAETDAGTEQFWPWPVHERITEAYLTADTAVSGKQKADMTAIGLTFAATDGYKYLYPLFLNRIDIDRVVKHLALAWCQWDEKLGELLRNFRIEEGSAGTPAIISARKLMQRALIQPTDEQFALADAGRKRTQIATERTREEQQAMDAVAAYYPPNTTWEANEWAKLRAVSRPLLLSPYSPGLLLNGTKGERGDIETRAGEIVPWLAERNLRICADEGNWSVAIAWSSQLRALPNGTNDDAVQATIGGVLPWVRKEMQGESGAGDEQGVDSSWLDGVT